MYALTTRHLARDHNVVFSLVSPPKQNQYFSHDWNIVWHIFHLSLCSRIGHVNGSYALLRSASCRDAVGSTNRKLAARIEKTAVVSTIFWNHHAHAHSFTNCCLLYSCNAHDIEYRKFYVLLDHHSRINY